MTVIAWDGRYLSVDRQTSGGGALVENCKLRRIKVAPTYKNHDSLIAWACTGYVTNNYIISKAITQQAEELLHSKKIDLSDLVQDTAEVDIRLQELAIVAIKRGNMTPVAYCLQGSGHLIEMEANPYFAVGSSDAVSHCVGFMSAYSSLVGELGKNVAVSELAVVSASKYSSYCGFGVNTIDMLHGTVTQK